MMESIAPRACYDARYAERDMHPDDHSEKSGVSRGNDDAADDGRVAGHVRYRRDCVAKLRLRRLANRDSVGLRRHLREQRMLGRQES
ncbi:hypothetical protein, partial [Bradyrhizobium sp. NAS80.1]|uniref:hypothetical protein n=1 Tax=Bradyrhizobium sp. NAS80.1 TaxID=1680159 RepID=UPI001AEF5606